MISTLCHDKMLCYKNAQGNQHMPGQEKAQGYEKALSHPRTLVHQGTPGHESARGSEQIPLGHEKALCCESRLGHECALCHEEALGHMTYYEKPPSHQRALGRQDALGRETTHESEPRLEEALGDQNTLGHENTLGHATALVYEEALSRRSRLGHRHNLGHEQAARDLHGAEGELGDRDASAERWEFKSCAVANKAKRTTVECARCASKKALAAIFFQAAVGVQYYDMSVHGYVFSRLCDLAANATAGVNFLLEELRNDKATFGTSCLGSLSSSPRASLAS
ncbi:unnamed protein product [Prorocentrum cordatum]|uniref:Uncharacterized protein n=1 Tax=Prorocentrum cordatum TaxID=2364126 RepID=A0ABN9T9K7_9DINO|nr:unnamed protein product [Polarella glacialis]